MPHLVHLRLRAWISAGDTAAIEAELAPQLEILEVPSSKLTAAGVAPLFGTGRFARLSQLDLSYNAPGDAIVAELVARARLPALTRLRLYGMGLTTAAAEVLAAWPAPLRHLDLGGNVEIRAAGVQRLVESRHLAALESLTVFPSNAERAAIADLLVKRFGRVTTDCYELRGST